MRLVAGEGAILAGIGATAGLIASVGIAGLLRGLLYGVAPIDPATVVVVAALTAVVSIIAASVPAWRASRVDPTTALRSE